MALTLDEIKYVNSKRKVPRPARYDAGLGSWTTVSEEFESLLILTPPSKKGNAANWINLLQQDLEDDTARFVVSADFAVREIAETEASLAALTLLTAPYELFRNDFVDSRFLGSAEVAQLLADTKAGAARLFSLKDRIEHRRIMAEAAQARYAQNNLSDDQRLQVSSWTISLLTPY